MACPLEAVPDRESLWRGELWEELNEPDRLGEAIRALPTRQREALVLRVYHNHAFAEIGAIMSCSEGTAKANYHHAVDKLRRVLVAGEGLS